MFLLSLMLKTVQNGAEAKTPDRLATSGFDSADNPALFYADQTANPQCREKVFTPLGSFLNFVLFFSLAQKGFSVAFLTLIA